VRVACEDLGAADLRRILTESEGSVLRQYERAFLAYGIESVFAEDALDRISALAAGEGTGARGLLTVCERLLRDFKFELPGTGVSSLRVDAALIDRPEERLNELRASGRDEQTRVLREAAEEYLARFQQTNGLFLRFSPEALEALIALAVSRNVPMRELCASLFKDYEFGLRLIRPAPGGEPLVLTLRAVEEPDKFLSELVVRSYRES